jgi:hypothetical protein
MKSPLFLILASSLTFGLMAPALAQQNSEPAETPASTPPVETKLKAKHEADKEHKYEELLKENGGDLTAEHWASEAIENLIKKYCGIMVGYPNNTFRGAQNMTRYEMAAALYKLMQCLEEPLKTVEREPLDTSHLASKDDLDKLVALQHELGKELEEIKLAKLQTRVNMIEKIQVNGSLDVRYREVLATTDGTDPQSPLFAGKNTSSENSVAIDGTVSKRDPASENTKAFNNNINQFGRDEFGVPNLYHSPSEANITPDDLVPFRFRTHFQVDAHWNEWLRSQIVMDVFDLAQASSALSKSPLIVSNGGHDVNEGLYDGNPFVFRSALTEVIVPDTKNRIRFGLMNFKGTLNTGTGFNSLFNQGNWNGHGFGLVGWGGSEVALSNNGASNYLNSIYRYWQGGIDASMVDPDSMIYNQASSPSVSFDTDWGWGSFMVGLNAGSTQTNRALAAASGANLSSGAPVMGSDANFATSAIWTGAQLQGLDFLAGSNGKKLTGNFLALPSQYGDGYGVVGLETRFFQESFPVRLQLSAMHYFNDSLTDFSAPSRKEISGTLDLGWNKNFGMTLQANKSFIGFDRHSLGLFFNNINDTDIDIQLGANLATRGLFNIGDTAAGSVGLAFGFPLWRPDKDAPQHIRFVAAARQSLGNRFGVLPEGSTIPNQLFKEAGITLGIPWKHVGNTSLDLTAQYSVMLADALWSLRQPVAHDISIVTSYNF